MLNYRSVLLILGACGSVSCGTNKTPVSNNPAQLQSTADILTLSKRSDGNFDVTCRDGTKEVRSQRDLDTGNLCEPLPRPTPVVTPTPTIDDPFDPRSCQGQPLTASEAFSKFQFPNNVSVALGKAALQIRSRACLTVDGCAGWNETPNWSSEGIQEYNGLFDLAEMDDSSSSHPKRRSSTLYGASFPELSLKINLVANRPQLALAVPYSGVSISSAVDFSGTSGFQTLPSSVRIGGDKITNLSLGAFGLLSQQKSQIRSYLPFESMKNAVRPANFVGVVNQHCTRYSVKNIIPMTYNDANTGTLEQEYAILFRY